MFEYLDRVTVSKPFRCPFSRKQQVFNSACVLMSELKVQRNLRRPFGNLRYGIIGKKLSEGLVQTRATGDGKLPIKDLPMQRVNKLVLHSGVSIATVLKACIAKELLLSAQLFTSIFN